jgi:hypothetical protein
VDIQLTIGFSAVADAADLNNFVAGEDEEEPVIAGPRPELFHTAQKRLDISRAGLGKSVQCMQNAH